MEKAYDIVGRLDCALGDSAKADLRDYTAQAPALEALREALGDAKALVEDGGAAMPVHAAIALVNHLNGTCKHFLIMKCPELALEAFRVEVRLPERVDTDSAESDALFAAMREKLDDLFAVAWNAKQQEPFIDAALAAKLGFTPAAMAFKSRLHTLNAEILMRRDETDAALSCLMEAYSSLADSVSQTDLKLDDARLKLLRDIRRCLDAKGDRRLARWLQRRMDIIKARNGEALDTPARYHPEGSLPPLREGWPCAAFAMSDARAAYEHLSGYRVVRHYGEGDEGRLYHQWDDGYRHLGLCPRCHGYILVQRSETHGGEDGYCGEFFPVSGPRAAEELNEKYDGSEIGERFPGRCLIESGGQVSWRD